MVGLNVQIDHANLLVKVPLRRYCVNAVGINEEMIGKYVNYQGKHEAEESQLSLKEVGREGSQRQDLVHPCGALKSPAMQVVFLSLRRFYQKL